MVETKVGRLCSSPLTLITTTMMIMMLVLTMMMMMMMMLVSVLSGPLLTMCRLGWPASDAAPLLTTLVPALNPPGSKNHLHHHLVFPDCQSLGLVTLLPVFSSLDGGLVRPRGSAQTTRHSFFSKGVRKLCRCHRGAGQKLIGSKFWVVPAPSALPTFL